MRSNSPKPARSELTFLSAEWRDLVVLNYAVDPDLLSRYVPAGTSLDSFRGRTYVSLVGFRFCRTRLLGCLPIPFHTEFDEVNLRFYVRRTEGSENRRGVVFIAEVVPKRLISATARLAYGENYMCLPMRHRIATQGSNKTIEYCWQIGDQWCRLSAQTVDPPKHPEEASLEQFITEHYWGYSSQRTGGCLEHHVAHTPWQVWATAMAEFEGEADALYGNELGAVIKHRPDSAFVADGSPVIVYKGNKIP